MLEALASALGARGLNVTLPLDAAAFDAACAPTLTLASLLPDARGALVVGAAGRAFFDGFTRARADGSLAVGPDPLDRYTRAVVDETTRAALAPLGVAHATHFPFMGASVGGVVIPFQRLGRAAGLAATSPLGLQIHPIYGAWWAYRALVVVDVELPPGAPLSDACAGCPAPCVTACPAGAVRREGFDVPACHARRRRPLSRCVRPAPTRLAAEGGPLAFR